MKKTLLFLAMSIGLLFACDKESSTEADQEELIKLQAQIKTLADESVCGTSFKLNYKPMGSKACGGPSSYIAYSSSIDTAKLILLINRYTDSERKYNQKYSISSTCDITSKPSTVTCENGKPKMNF